MDHCKQLQDVGGVGLLCSGEFAALIRDGVVMAVVVGLGEDRRERHLAGVGREDRAAARVEGPKDGGRGEAVLQAVKTPLLLRTPLPRGEWAAQARERGGDVGILIDKATVVVAQPDEATQLRVGGGDRPVPHCRNLALVDRNASRGDAVPEEAKLTAAKFTLGGLDIEPLLPEDREDLADVLQMLFERRAVAEHVVHVHHYRAM
jgi:hypothetical protein